jgi:hypothetical protein
LIFRPDGNLYVSDFTTDSRLPYVATTGAFVDTFIGPSIGGLDGPHAFTFGPDGNLYIPSVFTDNILRYDRTTGAFIDVFASTTAIKKPQAAIFGPDGNLYISSFSSNEILRFDGSTGVFIDVFVPVSSGGLNGPGFFTFREEVSEPSSLILCGLGPLSLLGYGWRQHGRKFMHRASTGDP